jgi:hypothetical protein
MFPEYSASDRDRIDGYNWDVVPEFRDEDGSLKTSQSQFDAQWVAAGLCPDPRMYEVDDSELLEALGLSGFQHYLVLGNEYHLELVAKHWDWRVTEVLR